MMSKRVLLLVNRSKPQSEAAVEQVRASIELNGSLVDILDAFGDCELPEPGAIDLVVVIGGDGTIMHAAKRCLLHGCPLIGVNTGKVGFMAGYELDRFVEDAPKLLNGQEPLRTIEVATMQGQLVSTDGVVKFEAQAVNDFVITAGPPYGLVKVDISIDGSPGPTISGDGAIVSSALGSTAYNVSSGGPIVSPELDARVVTPIAAHSLSFRPIVVPPSSLIRLTATQVNKDGSHGTTLLVDGQPGPVIEQDDSVLVSPSNGVIRFVVDPRVNYWSMLIQKMGWASSPTSGQVSS